MTAQGGVPHLLLINPNSSRATSEMMLAIAARAAGRRATVEVVTASRNPPMITTMLQLEAAADQVVELGITHASRCAGIIIGAFGDPGLALLRQRVAIPAVGLCEAAMIEAADGGRRFGVATVTPDLTQLIAQRAQELGLGHCYTGARCTNGNPMSLAGDPQRLQEELARQVRLCIADSAEAIIIGGGPLGKAAEALRPLFAQPIIAPIPSAVERLLVLLRVAPRGPEV